MKKESMLRSPLRVITLLAWAAAAAAGCASEDESNFAAANVEELRSSPVLSTLREPAILRSGAPLFISNNPEKFTSDGVLGGTLQAPNMVITNSVTGNQATRSFVPGALGAADPTCPANAVRQVDLYLYHHNDTGAAKSVHVLVHSAGAAVNVDFKGNLNTRSLPGGENPFQLANSVSVNTAQQQLARSFRHVGAVSVPAGDVKQVGAVIVDRDSPVDGRFELRGDGCFFVQVVASSNESSTSAARSHMASGEIRTPAPGKFGRTAGLYQASVLSWSEPTALSQVGSIWGYPFDTEAQGSLAHAHYTDSDADATANYGAFYRPEFTITNDTNACRRVSLRLATYPANDRPEAYVPPAKDPPTRFWDGPAHFINNSGGTEARFLQTSPGAMQQVIATGQVMPGSTIRWGLDIPVPGLISIPGAFLLEQDACTAP